MSGKPKCDVQAFVSKDSLFLSKDRVCELGMKSMYDSKGACACFDKLDGDSLIGIRRP
jgi:hypothetical protein